MTGTFKQEPEFKIAQKVSPMDIQKNRSKLLLTLGLVPKGQERQL
jgi:hypothetical protein